MHSTTHRGRSLRSLSDDSPSDEALLLGLGRGDPGTGITFVRRYQRRVYGLARSILGDPTQAEEVAQEALIRASRDASSYDPCRGSVSSWVLTITRNLAVDTLKRNGAQPADLRALISLEQPAHGSTPEEASTAADETTRLRTALFELPVEQRRALVLAAFSRMTTREISQAEAIPLDTAKARLRLGLTKLGALLGLGEAALEPGTARLATDLTRSNRAWRRHSLQAVVEQQVAGDCISRPN
jgi:RNA polymerase sigma-70 factor (ECF subfamily)